MGFSRVKQMLAKTAIRLWPTDAGMYRLLKFAPCVDPVQSLVTLRLRGFPLTLTVDPTTYMGKHIYYRGIYEEAAVALLKRFLCEKMTFVDVGANVGLYSVVAAHLIGKEGRVIAVEPQPEVVALLEHNSRINSLVNVTIHSLALAASSGTSLLHQVSRTNTGQATLRVLQEEKTFGEPVPVQTTNLRRLLSESGLNSVDGMKIDVEGAEMTVLEGYDWSKMAHPAFIFIECIEEHLRRFDSSCAEMIAFFTQRDYQFACRYRGKWRSVKNEREFAKSGRSSDCVAVLRETHAWRVLEEIIR